MYVYIYIYICIYICIYIHICTCIHIYKLLSYMQYTYMCVYTCMCTHVHPLLFDEPKSRRDDRIDTRCNLFDRPLPYHRDLFSLCRAILSTYRALYRALHRALLTCQN